MTSSTCHGWGGWGGGEGAMMVCMSDLDTSISQDCQVGQRAALLHSECTRSDDRLGGLSNHFLHLFWKGGSRRSNTQQVRTPALVAMEGGLTEDKTVCEGGIERLSGGVRSYYEDVLLRTCSEYEKLSETSATNRVNLF